jgi:hypothetical protein
MSYSSNWNGMDQGVEHTWEANQILGVLQILKEHEPFAYGDAHSPIYTDIEVAFPNFEWRGVDPRTKSFRNIFRRSNTWAKLGLVSGNNQYGRITKAGEDLLNGDLSLSEIILSACSLHEVDGEKPFAIIAAAFLEIPSFLFTLEDIEYGISKEYRPGDNLGKALALGRKVTVPLSNTRKRRLRSMMRQLVHTGAIKMNGASEWMADDLSALARISGLATSPIVAPGTSIPPTRPPKRRARSSSTRKYEKGAGTIRFSRDLTNESDPNQRLLLLEKATNEHEKVVEIVASEIDRLGGVPLEDPNGFDVACKDICRAIFEVKTWTKKNLKDQLRKAVAQLPEYRWNEREDFDGDTKQIIVLDRSVADEISDQYKEFLLNDRKIKLVWVEDGALVSHDGMQLSEVLEL